MPFYLGALRMYVHMLNIVTGYSNNTLSCPVLNREHDSEGFSEGLVKVSDRYNTHAAMSV